MTSTLLRSRPQYDLRLARSVAPIFEHMLGDAHSFLAPELTIWTSEAAEELRHRIEDNPMLGKLDQWSKLEDQLAGAPHEVIVLAAELVLLRDHPERTLTADTRVKHLTRLLRLTDIQDLPAPAKQLFEQREPSGFKGGQGYHGSLWKQLIWMAKFVVHLRSQNSSTREAAHADAWEFQRLMLDIDEDTSGARNALQFLAFPEAFEPISSNPMKAKIRHGFANRITPTPGDDPAAVDRDLLAIREVLANEHDEPFHFWSAGIVEHWNPSAKLTPRPEPEETESQETRGVHYWAFAPGTNASNWEAQRREGVMALNWSSLGDFGQYTSREEIREALDTEGTGKAAPNDTLAVWEFQHCMEPGDIVYARRGRTELVGRGVVVGAPEFHTERTQFRNTRAVKWTDTGSWEAPSAFAMKTLTDITRYDERVEALEAIFDTSPAIEQPVAAAREYTRNDFLRDVFLSEERFDRLSSLLQRKKNVILAGPPGVGKTYAARQLAYALMGSTDDTRISMVQFHQSYSYEDFVIGYRPTESGSFTLQYGPFYEFCERAREDLDRDYFFLIDEINRGNISKIFGELLMLLESSKRGRSLRLLYGKERFSVPPNIYVIGMMNTADKSLALLDYALRRRFGFFDLPPAFESTQFQKYLEQQNSPQLIELVAQLESLNDAITADPALGRGFAIGHSFVMAADSALEHNLWLESVVEDELIPLLNEYWFDQPELALAWSDALRGAIDG
ncbi:restriction endonuclease [Corynebacterium hadale]|uniref:Restriction endonuclease n=1 Tax=Corynebacterium hadale TaxID=2026255 RepID=A0AB36RKP6_9CORY|nr:AAA family ATPase [Corynebacterium hadale]PAT10784.1 restriction endonuclease [Corynebacterium hadale]